VYFDFFRLNERQFSAGHIEQKLCRKFFFDSVDRFSSAWQAASAHNLKITRAR
jgi:hypothetical protein